MRQVIDISRGVISNAPTPSQSDSSDSSVSESLSNEENRPPEPVGVGLLTRSYALSNRTHIRTENSFRPILRDLPIDSHGSVIPIYGTFKNTRKGQSQSKAWCFTINNPTAECRIALEKNLVDPIINIKFMMWAFEQGEQGTKHFQGYVKFHRKKRCHLVMRDVLRVWSEHGDWPHIEPAKGGEMANFNYISGHKSTGFVAPIKWVPEDPNGYLKQIGEPADDMQKHGNQGKRTDIEEFQKYCIDNPFEEELIVAIKFPLLHMQHCNAFQKFRNMCQAQWIKKNFFTSARSRGVKVYWFWGPSNAGKTHAIKAMTKDQDVYWKCVPKWWPGYAGEKYIVIDDARPAMFPMWRLLMLLDSTPFYVEQKGGGAYVMAHTVIISCPWHPRDFYRSTDDDCQQIINRILNRENPGEIREFHARPLRVLARSQHHPGFRGMEEQGPPPYNPPNQCMCNNLVCQC